MLCLLKRVLLMYFGFMTTGITCQYIKNSGSSSSQKAREIPAMFISNDFHPSFGSRLSTFHHSLRKVIAHPEVSNINRSVKYRNQSQSLVPFQMFTQGDEPLDGSFRTKQSTKATASLDENKNSYPVNISNSSSVENYRRSNISARLNDAKYHIPKSEKKKLRKKQKEIQVISKLDAQVQNAGLPKFLENDFSSVFDDAHNFLLDSQKLPIILEKQKSDPRMLENDSGEELAIPCSCLYSQEECGCNCTGSLSYDDFQDLSKIFHSCSRFSFLLSDGDYYAFPPNLFYNVGCVEHFNLTLSNATFDYLFDPSPYTSAFGGVCFQKTGLVKLQKVNVRRAWNWTPLEQLTKPSGSTMDIEIDGCGLRRLSSDFSRVSGESLKTLSISDSELEMLGSGAFARFERMVHIRLPKNRLQSIHREDLPPNAQELQEIDLRYNRLESLGNDLFEDMPSLKVVSLAGNPIRMLSEITFGAIIGKTFLQGVSDFPLYCDCRLRWLKNSTLSQNTIVLQNLKDATCRRPPYLRGTPFKDLSKEHLIC